MDIKTAEGLARQRVRLLWPDLAGVEPTVAPRSDEAVSPELARRLGLEPRQTPRDGEEYTFTFAGERPSPDGQAAPVVARVVVNMRRGVVKTSISK